MTDGSKMLWMILKRLKATQSPSSTSFAPCVGSRAEAALGRAREMQLRSASVWQRNQPVKQTHQGGSAVSKRASEHRQQVNVRPWENIGLQAPSRSPVGALGGQGHKTVLLLYLQGSRPAPLPSHPCWHGGEGSSICPALYAARAELQPALAGPGSLGGDT